MILDRIKIALALPMLLLIGQDFAGLPPRCPLN